MIKVIDMTLLDSSANGIPGPLQAYHQRALAMRWSSCIDFPAHVHLETQAICNGSCVFCPYSELERKGTRMDDRLLEKIINDLADIPKLHRFQLSLMKVNEPFLDKRIFDIIDTCMGKLPHATITLTSNASPINEKVIEKLSKTRSLGYLWISFNDHREAEYEKIMGLPYRRTRERLDLLHRAKAEGKLTMRIVLSRVSDGSGDDHEFIKWVKQHYPLFEASLFPRANWIGQTGNPTNTPIPPIACTRWFDLSITATGQVAHCCMDGQAQYPIGDINHQHALDIYNHPSYRRLRTSIENRQQVEPCRYCNFL